MSMQVYKRTTSLVGSRRNSVKEMVIWAAPVGAMIHKQFELFEYGDGPDPSESVPLAARSSPHEDPQPVHVNVVKPCCCERHNANLDSVCFFEDLPCSGSDGNFLMTLD